MIQRLGRMPGNGKLRREQRGRDCQPVWVLDYQQANGARKRVALSTDKRVAEMKQRELLRERDMEVMGLGSAAGQSKPLQDIVDLYLEDLATRATPVHCKNARARLEHVLARIRANRVCDIQPMALVSYRAQRLRDGCAVRTANLHVDTLRACLTWAVRLGLIAANPLAQMPRLPENEATKKCRRRAMSEAEIEEFLAATHDDDVHNAAHHKRVPQHAFFRFLLETGARYGETTAITWADLDLDRELVVLRAANTKARRERVIPLLEGLVEELRALQTHHVSVLKRPLRPSDRVFLSATGCPWPRPTVNLMRIFDRLLEGAGIDRVDAQGRKLDVHALRHTFASRLARNGVGLAQVQRLLGHSDPKLTAQVYTHLDAEDLRDAVGNLRKSASASMSSRSA
jgi:integrase